mmetsp:Transcript_31415/g.73344  ORF Transcript_31415/g.73344 Transcript_31415/m.73344 type:complete len:664 (+) Transcript_31415:83-2074(+)
MGQSCSANLDGNATTLKEPGSQSSSSNCGITSRQRPVAANGRGSLPTPGDREDIASSGPDPLVPISVAGLAIYQGGKSSSQNGAKSGRSRGSEWRSWYVLGRELGHGISATVYEAEAFAAAADFDVAGARSSGSGSGGGLLCGVGISRQVSVCGAAFAPPCLPKFRRRVALKRFKKLHSRSFQTELRALSKVGVHPNVVRLLESYEDCGGEDVLVLEFCDGATVFELFAGSRRKRKPLPEVLVTRCIRQLLLALEHLIACGVDHQDVKPENMMLYNVSIEEQRAELKLGDFGWARTRPGKPDPAFADGAGSLWYAPPELNPPMQVKEDYPPLGTSDMWSVGVVVYLLLVGHNPFHRAQKMKSSKAIEAEVLRLVDQGSFDTSSAGWLDLSDEARDFVSSMLQTEPAKRLTPSDALRHPYLVKQTAQSSQEASPQPPWRWLDREELWSQLDGLQRLGWVAVARAISEPELRREAVASASKAVKTASAKCSNGHSQEMYLWQLARELGTSPAITWLHNQAAWTEVLRLAFRYLDVDNDGLLSPKDLIVHLVVEDPAALDDVKSEPWLAANLWVSRWARNPDSMSVAPEKEAAGLTPANFRSALLASHRNGSAVFDEDVTEDLEDGDNEDWADIPGLTPSRRAARGHRGRFRDEAVCGAWGPEAPL